MKKDFIVKICGVRNVENAEKVLAYKPTLLGMVFVPGATREVDVETARSISNLVEDAGVQTAGLFMNQPIEEVWNVLEAVPLDVVQLHGEEDAAYCRSIPVPVIKKISITTLEETQQRIESYGNSVYLFLVDREKQGTGPVPDISLVKELADKYSIMLAGGLRPDTIARAVETVGKNLRGVDVSGGVERRAGEKDEKLVASFIMNAREAYGKL